MLVCARILLAFETVDGGVVAGEGYFAWLNVFYFLPSPRRHPTAPTAPPLPLYKLYPQGSPSSPPSLSNHHLVRLSAPPRDRTDSSHARRRREISAS